MDWWSLIQRAKLHGWRIWYVEYRYGWPARYYLERCPRTRGKRRHDRGRCIAVCVHDNLIRRS